MITCRCGCETKLRKDNKTGYAKCHKPCVVCNTPVNRSDTECCSKKCSAILHWQRHPEMKSSRCWNKKRNDTRNKNQKWRENLSLAVKNQYKNGRVTWSKGKVFNPELTNKDRIDKRNLAEYRDWIQAIFKRDSYICQITGKNGKLSAHHLDSWNKFPDKRFDLNNGITILKSIHTLFHNIYGRGNNTKEQFYEFVSRIHSKELKV